jgi:penicillin-binding protein 1A
MLNEQAGWAIDTDIKRLAPKIKDLLSGGYDIYLTIDLPTQKLAEEAVKWNYRRILAKRPDLNGTLNGAMITIDQTTGEVKAIVGGVKYEKFGYNRAYQAERSLGSGIKPFIYSIALNNGYNPATLIPDIPKTYKVKINGVWRLWKPHNYERNSLGMITLRDALVHSRNLATLNLVAMLGLDKVVAGLKKFGFKKFPENMSIGLGSFGNSVWDFAERYTNISNYGKESKLFIVKKVVKQRSGEVVLENHPQHRVTEPPEQAYLMINIMEDVVKRGTGTRAKVNGIEVAGKTGTTNDYRDAWFNGFTPDTETIIWFGNDNYTSLGRGMTGGRVSAPLFAYFYKKLLIIHPELKRHFKIPKGVKKFTLPNGKVELYTKESPPPNFTGSPAQTPSSPLF